jgi:hypothetical protein
VPHPRAVVPWWRAALSLPIKMGRPPILFLIRLSPKRRCPSRNRFSRSQKNQYGALWTSMPNNQRLNHFGKVWLHALFWEATVVEKLLPNMLDRKPMFIRILLFGFLYFLWLTCKAPSLVGDLNLATKLVLQTYSSSGSSLVLDCGCTNHMTQERSMFQSYSPKLDSNKNIVFGDNSRGDVLGLGKVAITLQHSITNVLHADSLSYNLWSVSQLF